MTVEEGVAFFENLPRIKRKLQTLLDVGLGLSLIHIFTGSGKTFTIANTIAKVNKPTLVLAHNKTLAAQLCNEFKEFFPNSAVEYFVSYYDYYQPEAYIPGTDTYIETVSYTHLDVYKRQILDFNMLI